MKQKSVKSLVGGASLLVMMAMPASAQDALTEVMGQCTAVPCGCEAAVSGFVGSLPSGTLLETAYIGVIVAEVETMAAQAGNTTDRNCYANVLTSIADEVEAEDPALGATLRDIATIASDGPFDPGQAVAAADAPTGAVLGARSLASNN